MQLQKSVWVVALTALAYMGLFSFNQFVFPLLDVSSARGLVFLPSGLQLIGVLLFVEWGALGLVLGALAMGLGPLYAGDPITALGAALLAGLAPLFARALCVRYDALDEDLHGLSAAALLRLTVVFSALSALLGQLWLLGRNQGGDLWAGMALHFTGDLLGTLIVLYSAKLVLDRLPQLSRG